MKLLTLIMNLLVLSGLAYKAHTDTVLILLFSIPFVLTLLFTILEFEPEFIGNLNAALLTLGVIIFLSKVLTDGINLNQSLLLGTLMLVTFCNMIVNKRIRLRALESGENSNPFA